MSDDPATYSDTDELASIALMDVWELLDYVVNNPEVMTDPYYKAFGSAVKGRYDALSGSTARSGAVVENCTMSSCCGAPVRRKP